MAKINATYGAGYYMDPSINYAQVEDAQRREGRKNRLAGVAQVMRQTFSAPFNIICTGCDGRTARGTHQYVNRRKTGEKFMGMPIWELEFRCQHCMKYFAIVTDWETPKVTGGYKCVKNCKRPESDDFVARNLANVAVDAERKQAKENETLGSSGNMDALAKHNDRMDRVHQLNADIEARLAERSLALHCENDDGNETVDDPLSCHYGAVESMKPTTSLRGRIAERIRMKRRREDVADREGGADMSDEAAPADGDDDDGNFAAFQKMLSATVGITGAGDAMPTTTAADEGMVTPTDADIKVGATLDQVRLMMSAADNPFSVVEDPQVATQHMSLDNGTVCSDGNCVESSSSTVVVLKKKKRNTAVNALLGNL